MTNIRSSRDSGHVTMKRFTGQARYHIEHSRSDFVVLFFCNVGLDTWSKYSNFQLDNKIICPRFDIYHLAQMKNSSETNLYQKLILVM